MSLFRWLHCSDIHLPSGSEDTYEVDKVLKALIETLREEAENGKKPDVIFFTGDIAKKGKDYSKAEMFFDELLRATGLEERYGNKARELLFIIPGNHDVDRAKCKSKTLLRTLNTKEHANEFFSPQSLKIRQPYSKRFHAYAEFFNRYFFGIRRFNADKIYFSELRDINYIPLRLGIIGLNTAWFSQDNKDEHKLWIGERTCDEAFDNINKAGGAELIIALHHHPYAWLHPGEISQVKGLLTEKADICLYGHMHTPELEQIKDAHGKVLRFQSGATYVNSPHPYRILMGNLDCNLGKVYIRPITYQDGPPRRWTLDTSVFPNKPDYIGDFDLSRPISRKTKIVTQCNPESFYSGGMATEADIEANLDVPRTQYIRTWVDEKGLTHKPWRDVLLTQAKQTIPNEDFRIVILYGHRGGGKTTLYMRMIHDLKVSSIPVINLLNAPLSPDLLKTIKRDLIDVPKKRNHIFTKIEDIQITILNHQFLSAIKQLADLNMPITVYVSIDTNKWKQIEAKIGSTIRLFNCRLESKHLRGQIDEQELSELIAKLKRHHCLFRLKHKSENTIRSAFRRKAKKSLLTSLIEATRGTEKCQGLEEILLQEYQDLSTNAKWAYEIVMLFSAFGIPVPYSIMESSMNELVGEQGYFESQLFNTETAEIVYRPNTDSYSARNRLIAETILQKFTGEEWDGKKYRVLCAVFSSWDPLTAKHQTFFQRVLEQKVLRTITDLNSFIQNIINGKLKNIKGHDISRVLNSIIRIYQGRGNYEEGKNLAIESLKHWNHIANQASYLKAFCCYQLGETLEVKKAIINLVDAIDFPFHVLHGIALLRVMRNWEEADKALKKFENSMGNDIALYTDYHRLRKDVDLGISVTWSDSDLDSTKPSRALEKIEILFVDRGADEKTIITHYKNLIRRVHTYMQAYISFFSWLRLQQKDEDDLDILISHFNILKLECEYHIYQHEDYKKKYPKEILSILHSHLARSLFKIDYFLKKGYPQKDDCDAHFLKSLNLKVDNWYAHNWYGTFLKEVIGDWYGAKTQYECAINGNVKNPVFKNNLALLYYQVPKFSQIDLEKSRRLCLSAISLCKEGSKWEFFRFYPEELYSKVSLLLKRTDLKDGDPLDTDTSLSIDAD